MGKACQQNALLANVWYAPVSNTAKEIHAVDAARFSLRRRACQARNCQRDSTRPKRELRPLFHWHTVGQFDSAAPIACTLTKCAGIRHYGKSAMLPSAKGNTMPDDDGYAVLDNMNDRVVNAVIQAERRGAEESEIVEEILEALIVRPGYKELIYKYVAYLQKNDSPATVQEPFPA
jgi:hypothetical protein